MNVSCLPVSLFPALIDGRMSVGEWAAMAAEIGLDGIDVSVLFFRDHTPRLLAKVRDDLEQAGLPVVMVTTYPDFTNPDPVQCEREADYCRRDIALASQLGARYLRITAGQAYPGVSVDDGVRRVVESFKRMAEAGERFGVGLLFENHSKPGAWDLPDFGYPTEVFLRIAEAIRDTGIGINFDLANPLSFGDDPLPVLESVIDQVTTVHASDIAARGRFYPVLLGEGIVPFDALFGRLKQHGFDGWICIEEASRLGADGIKAATEFVRRKWAGM